MHGGLAPVGGSAPTISNDYIRPAGSPYASATRRFSSSSTTRGFI
jgi:hypothetical protein